MTVDSNPAASAARSRGVTAPGMRKLAVDVARRIEADILAAGWQVGTVFGSQSDLRERYGVSRAVLREAILLVEHHKVATMRRGPSGGLVIQTPDAEAMTAATVIYLEHVGTSVEDLLAARLLLEPLAARQAADRMDEIGIKTLRETLEEELASPDETGGRSLLHATLGQLSGNAALRLFIEVLADLTTRYAQRPKRFTAQDAGALKANSDHRHHMIVEAITAGDTALAVRRTVAHLESIRTWLLSTRQRPITNKSQSKNDNRGDGDRKLGETIARRLMTDIAVTGAEVGDVIGSESELLDRFAVSRAVLREAIRLLEYHSVARMRKGPRGGLVVTEPDAAASVEAMAIYLDYENVDMANLRVVREAIEIGCVELVTARSGEPVVAKRLRAALRAEATAPAEHMIERAHQLHMEIADLAGNPVLALFLSIITTAEARHTAPGHNRPGEERVPELTARTHELIVEAILAGDLPLARHRMQRHLKALTPS